MLLLATASLCLFTLQSATAAELVLQGTAANGCSSSSWFSSIDTVMGGQSSLSYRCDGDVFEANGYLSVNGGGFAGVSRKLSSSADLSDYNGIEVTYGALDGGDSTAVVPPLAIEMRLSAVG